MKTFILDVSLGVIIVACSAIIWKSGALNSATPRTSHQPNVDIPRVAGLLPKGDIPTVALLLSTKCRFCQQNTPLYKTLAKHSGIHVVALFPQSEKEVQKYLADHDLHVEYRSAVPFHDLGVTVTPTILLVDPDGKPKRYWIGSQDKAGVEEILRQP